MAVELVTSEPAIAVVPSYTRLGAVMLRFAASGVTAM